MKLTKTKLFNSKGMSLLAVLIASAVGAVIVIGMTQYQSNLLTSINQIKQEANLTIFRSEITRKFKSNDYKTCTDTVRGFVDSSNNIEDRSIINGSNTLYSAGQVRNSSSIKIQKIQVRAGTANDKKIELYVYFTTNKKNQPYLPISFPLVLEAEVSYDISSSSSSPIVKECTDATSVPIAVSPDCLTAENSDSNKKTLLGCGTTKDNKGRYTVALGYNAGSSNSTGTSNNFIGYRAGYYNTSGAYNNFTGHYAGHYNKTGTYNNFLGYLAGYRNTSGAYNNFIGYYAGLSNLSGRFNNFMGYRAGYYNKTGTYNNFTGYYAGYYNTSGTYNNFTGYYAGYYNKTGHTNNFIGYEAGKANKTGHTNNFIGNQAGYKNTTGSYNNFLGNQAGYKNTTGSYNNFLGNQAGLSNLSGRFNNFMGNQAGFSNTTGHSNNFMGAQAGFSNTTGRWNNFMGHKAGSINITGDGNICFGFKSCGGRLSSAKHVDNQAELTTFKATSSTKGTVRELRTKDINSIHPNISTTSLKPLKKFSKIASLTAKPLDSSFNEVVALGSKAGYMSSGDKNVFVGSQSGSKNILGEHNTFIGYNSGLHSRLGDHNTYIGAEVGASKKDSSSYPKKDKSYQLNLANTLYGNINKKSSYPFPIKASSLVFDSSLTISKDLEVIGNIKTKKDINILGNLKAKKANIKYLEVDYLKVNNPQYIASYQNPLSSKQYKKNIESYDSYKDSLNKILNIKLYNYHYKDKDHNPNKQRMGVISEYLDPVFQLKDNNISKNKSIIMPDWPTIYGSLIASVKAIYSKLTNLIKDFQDFKKLIFSELEVLKNTDSKLNKDLDKTNKELSNTNKELLNLKQEMLELKKQIKALK